jgi:hypothetical protein
MEDAPEMMMMDEAMGEEAPLMDAASAMEAVEEPKKTKTLDDLALEEQGCLCCCCICHCSTEETRELKCFGCFPVKCGVIAIGVFTIALFFAVLGEVFYCLLNDSYDWWYVFIGVLLLVPFFIGVTFFITFFSNDTNNSRSRLFVACQFVIISVCLLSIWNICYIQWCYKHSDVLTGSPDQGYYKQSKKAFIVWSLFLSTCISFLYAYFICVTRSYCAALKSDEDLAADKETKRKEEEEKKKGGMFGIKLPLPGAAAEEPAMAAEEPAKAM